MTTEAKSRQDELRARAEARLAAAAKPVENLSMDQIKDLIHEYEVHRIELEIQNEELREAQKQLQAARDRFAELYDNAPVGYLSIDEAGVITQGNRTFAAMLGHAQHHLPGKALDDFVLPADRPTFHGRFKAFFKNPEGKQLHFSLKGRAGELAVLCVGVTDRQNFAPPASASGKQLLLAVSDVTEQKKNREQLEQSEEKFRELFETAPVGIFQCTPAGRYLFVNPELARIAGYADPGQMVEAVPDIAKLYVQPEQREEYKQQLYARGQTRNFEAELMRPDGSTFWASMNATLKQKDNGEKIFDGYLLDVSERVHAEQALRDREQFLNAILHTTQDGFWILDMHGHVTEVNEAYCRMTGYTAEEMKQMRIPDLEARENAERVAIRSRRIMHNGSELFETIHRRKDGGLIDVEVSVSFLPGAAPRMICFCRDITERKRLAKALRENEERYRLLADMTMEGIVIHQNGVARDCNASLCRLLGYDREELLGVNLLKLIISEEERDTVRENIAKEYAKPYVVRALKKSGEPFYAEIEARDFHFQGEKLRVASIRDITERLRAQEIIKHQNTQLKMLLAEKDKFFSIIAHDLKSPMSGLLGLSRLFLEEAGNMTLKELRNVAEAMHKSSELLYALMDNLLTWSLMQQGMMEYAPAPRSLRDLVRESVAPLLSVAEHKKIAVEQRVPADLMALADARMLTTVLRNLVSNALKFTASGGSVDIVARKEGGMLQVSVRDSGTGMDAQTLAGIFSIDRKTTRPGTAGESGTGLGLALCKEFVEKHGGRIWAESAPGRGSTFHVTVPAQE